MSDLPKFVSERMKASVPPIGHPDPDLLTAFSERSLPAHERAVVMEHLARCGECRDVVALALPATEAVTETARFAQHAWFRWPVLRWGALAAGVLIITTVGIQQYRERHQNLAAFVAGKPAAQDGRVQDGRVKDQMARNDAPGAEPQPGLLQPSAAASQPETAPSKSEAAVAGSAPTPAEPVSSDVSARARSYRMGGALGGPVVKGVGGIGAANQLSKNQQINQLETNSPTKESFAFLANSVPSAPPGAARPSRSASGVAVPSASGSLEGSLGAGASPLRDGQKQGGQKQDEGQAQNRLDRKPSQSQPGDKEQAYTYSEGDRTLSKAKPVPEKVEVSAPAAAPALDAASSAAPLLAARNTATLQGPAWSITATGGLQRSVDNKKTWQDVNVTAGPAAVSRLTTEEVAVYSHEKKSRENKDAQAAKLQAGAAPVFRAVAASGLEVWAGGSAGALFHSADAGDHWTRIFPIAGSTPLTADITAIRFSDPQHGTVTTAISEVWTTADAGASWEKH